MMKYRKKPIVIDAMQFQDDVDVLIALGDLGLDPVKVDYSENVLIIDTLEGTMKVSIGDFIIKGVKGEFYPCKPDIFEATYEKVI